MNNIILVTTTTWCFWEVIPIPNGAEWTSWWATRCNLRGAFKCSLRQRELPLHWVQQSLVVLWVKAKRCQASWQRTVPTEWPVNHLPPVFWKRAKKADCLSVETWNCSPSSECPSSLIPSHIRRWFFLYLWTSHLCLQRAKAEINNWLKQEREKLKLHRVDSSFSSSVMSRDLPNTHWIRGEELICFTRSEAKKHYQPLPDLEELERRGPSNGSDAWQGHCQCLIACCLFYTLIESCFTGIRWW